MTRAEKDAYLAKGADEQARRVACAREAVKAVPDWLQHQVAYNKANQDCLIAAGLVAPPAAPSAAEEEQRRRNECVNQAHKDHPNYLNGGEAWTRFLAAQNACLQPSGSPASTPAVSNRTPPPTDSPAPLPPPRAPVMSTFSTGPVPRAGALSLADFTSQWVGKAVVATGTVARVETIRGYEHLYFQGAGSKLVVCFAQGFGGVKNTSELIGKTIEVNVRIDSPASCLDHRIETLGAAEIRQVNQLRVIGDARPAK
jgi:hypothetical protein